VLVQSPNEVESHVYGRCRRGGERNDDKLKSGRADAATSYRFVEEKTDRIFGINLGGVDQKLWGGGG
jgi:hypothetical protein